MVHEWSLEDFSLPLSQRHKVLFSKPNGLKLRRDGYSWFRTHINNSNYVRINPSGRKLRSEELSLGKVDALWAVTSSSGSTMKSLREHAKIRMSVRLSPGKSCSFSEHMEIRQSCWILEERNGKFYCDCPIGMKGHMCKVR